MPIHLQIAEKVHQQILLKHQHFMLDPVNDLNILMREINKAVKGTEVELEYKYLDFENLILRDANCVKKVDLSLIPNVKNSQEFCLWLASFIENIAVKKSVERQPLRFDLENIGDLKRATTPLFGADEGQAIVEYFKAIQNSSDLDSQVNEV